MKILIVYDSQYGKTEHVARCIASTLSEFGDARAVRIGQIHPSEITGVDMLILGCPTQGMRQTAGMQAFIARIPRDLLSDLSIACFDTRFQGGFWMLSAAPAMAKQFKTMGVELVVQPESFYVKSMKREGPLLPGEIERAAGWAHMLSEKMAAYPVAMKA
ncbi:MAG TPA: flavodoxin domain-containing protein [Ktedonobacteraceae bacterium]|nr:flavodoxin domain-containing protein [Ktedonobacteraceae bacterium]